MASRTLQPKDYPKTSISLLDVIIYVIFFWLFRLCSVITVLLTAIHGTGNSKPVIQLNHPIIYLNNDLLLQQLTLPVLTPDFLVP
jgi:hypothetical protein